MRKAAKDARDEAYLEQLRAGRTVEEIYAEKSSPLDGDGRVLESIQGVADEFYRNESQNAF
ncbi:MAG: hypothetical protein ABWX76_14585 [Leifsonia flava]